MAKEDCFLDSTETLQAILDADKEASRIYDEAVSQRADLDGRISRGKERLTLKYETEISTAIAEAEKAEAGRADTELARIDAETNARLASLREAFEKSRGGYIDTVYGLIIGE
jgi:hypothetical protein